MRVIVLRGVYAHLGLGILAFLLACLGLQAPAQEIPKHLRYELEDLLIEDYLVDQSADVDLSEYIDRLRHYLRYPIDLNQADQASLQDLFFLSAAQVEQILAHRRLSGAFISLLELQALPSFSPTDVERLLPFVTLRPPSLSEGLPWKTLLSASQSDVILRYGRVLESQQGYTITDSSRSRYLGSPDRWMLRYRLKSGSKMQLAVNMEKDAGEPFFKHKQKAGFDHYGLSLQLSDIGPIQRLVLGDFSLQVGQGLVAWQGLAFGKGAQLQSLLKQGVGMRAYTSMTESNYFRGLSATAKLGSVALTPFVSYQALSGNMVDTDSGRYILSLSTSGLHRTPTEQASRKAIAQMAYGTVASWRNNGLQLGMIAMSTHFDGSFQRRPAARYRYDFTGRSLSNVGVNYQYSFYNLLLYGELAHSIGSGLATVNGLLMTLHPAWYVHVNYRHYNSDYHSFFAQAVGEGSQVANEQGIYGGIMFLPSRNFEWTSYVDYVFFPWLRYRVNSASTATDFFSQATYSWYKVGKIALRYRYRRKQENTLVGSSNSPLVVHTFKNQLRLDFQYQLNNTWKIRSRVEGIDYFKQYGPNDYGWLVYQDVFWNGATTKWQTNMRVALFSADAYEARLYAYENDVLYAYSYPLYYNQGLRTYVNVRYRPLPKVDLWMRYAVTFYSGQSAVGSGLDRSQGAKRSDLKLQIRYQW